MAANYLHASLPGEPPVSNRPPAANTAIDCRNTLEENISSMFRIVILTLTSLFWKTRQLIPPEVLARTNLSHQEALEIPDEPLERYRSPPGEEMYNDIYSTIDDAPSLVESWFYAWKNPHSGGISSTLPCFFFPNT